jgi:hypothetical protein
MHAGGIHKQVDSEPKDKGSTKQEPSGCLKGKKKNEQDIEIRIDHATDLDIIQQQYLNQNNNNEPDNIPAE